MPPVSKFLKRSGFQLAVSAKKIPDVGCGGTDEGKRPEFSGKSMRDESLK